MTAGERYGFITFGNFVEFVASMEKAVYENTRLIV